MHITVEPRDDHAVLYLRGEFDTFYVPTLQQEISALAKTGMHRLVLDMRFVKFINSTALGAIIKASKEASKQGGRLVISRPSPFCRDILEKIGLDRAVSIFDKEEDAQAEVVRDTKVEAKRPEAADEAEASTVLFSPVDLSRLEHFLSQSKHIVKPPMSKDKPEVGWSGSGRMAALDANGVRFTWSGGNTGLSPFAMGQLLAMGTEWRVKFQMPMYKRGWCEAACVVRELDERADSVKVGAVFSKIDEATRNAIKQYANDMAFLKEELKKATDK
ncbi:MAG: STAS domain-containing protein [Planctomycetes bacterium]|nr:STAS domain-containing protein [Planctomycetota bacterium]